jgi:hypothetical protein
VEILRLLRLRYFSPEELLQLFCFEKVGSGSTFRWPEGVSTKTKYRLIGNSVNVFVVSALIQYLCYVTNRAWESHGMCRPRVRVSEGVGFFFLRTTTIDLLSRVLAVFSRPQPSFFSLTPHSIFCVSRGFMLLPLSDSRQLLRCIHPNICPTMAATTFNQARVVALVR